MSNIEVNKSIKQKKRSKRYQKISFDEEIVIKTSTKPINTVTVKEAKPTSEPIVDIKLLKTNQHPKHDKKLKQRKQKHKEKEANVDNESENVTSQVELDPNNPKIERTESKRAIKRKKHQQLLTEKKLKIELDMQQKCLNYLSRWKHSPNDWKFEKLRQIWLQQNMFDTDKVPDQFWKTAVEYFNKAKGKIRTIILDNALKIVEENDNVINEDSSNSKFHRAKDIVQNLQE